MKIYLANNFKARWWLRDYITILEANGHIVTSRWIVDDSHAEKPITAMNPYGRSPEEQQKIALKDFEDIDAADALILFTDQYGDSPGKGKFMEYGYAFAKGKKIYIHGQDHKNSVFYYLPGVIILTLISDLK